MTGVAEVVRAVRDGAGVFVHGARRVVAITGDDRTRWLDGMLSNEIAALAPPPTEHDGPGCYALLLTHQGRIVADPHVLARSDAYWLDIAQAAVSALCERLEKHVIADDVAIVDIGDAVERLGVEGPAAARLLAELAGGALDLAPHAWTERRVLDAPVSIARFGFAGDGYQLFAPLGTGDAIAAALEARGAVAADSAVLDALRIEAGIPAFGAELDETVLPAEARLQHAVSTTKGCYIGQEVVARMESRGRSSHLLVGLELEGEPPTIGSAVELDGREVGEVTSSCASPKVGALALAYVRSAVAEPGSRVEVAGRPARVVSLPFAAPAPAAREPLGS